MATTEYCAIPYLRGKTQTQKAWKNQDGKYFAVAYCMPVHLGKPEGLPAAGIGVPAGPGAHEERRGAGDPRHGRGEARQLHRLLSLLRLHDAGIPVLSHAVALRRRDLPGGAHERGGAHGVHRPL